MPRYTEIEHTADIGVEAYGDTLEALFANAAYALFDTIAAADTIEPALTRTITLQADDAESLLMTWLRELLYLFAVEQEVYGRFQISILQREGSPATELSAEIAGEPLDFEKHRFETEIKAITYHQFAVHQESDNQWRATIVFDV